MSISTPGAGAAAPPDEPESGPPSEGGGEQDSTLRQKEGGGEQDSTLRQKMERQLERLRHQVDRYMWRHRAFLWSVFAIIGYYALSVWFYGENEGTREDDWDWVDCVYFAVVTCTTIGFGDIVPREDNKWFTILFAIAGVMIVMRAMQAVGIWMDHYNSKAKAAAMRYMLKQTMEAAERNKDTTYERKQFAAASDSKGEKAAVATRLALEQLKKAAADTERTLSRLVLCLLTLYAWLVRKAVSVDAFFAAKCGPSYERPRTLVANAVCVGWPVVTYLWLGASLGSLEGWSFSEACYFSITTVLTIGYGDVIPTTRMGKIFCIFYIPSALGVITLTLSNLVALRIKWQTTEISLHKVLHMDGDCDGKVSEYEFVRANLLASGEVSADTLAAIRTQFAILDQDGDGFLAGVELQSTEGISVTLVDAQRAHAFAEECTDAEAAKEEEGATGRCAVSTGQPRKYVL